MVRTLGVGVDVWPGDFPNPFSYLGAQAGKIVADGWTAAMLGLWNAGMWALRLVLQIMDAFLVPDLSEDGPGALVYQTAFWIAAVLVVLMGTIQLGIAALRRDGSGLARVLIGAGQFVMVWATWVVYAVAVLAAAGGLTRALMGTLLNVDSWSAFEPWEQFSTSDITDGTVATVLGLLGLVLWLAAIGHLLVMLARGGALMVLAATAPICAAGLVSDSGSTWFWKSLRWFHASAFTPVIMVLVLGIGVQMTTGVATGGTDNTQAAIGTALPGVVLICISCVAPLALFKLLAFVDPTTASGAGMRAGWKAHGGLSGLIGATSPSGSAAASTTSGDGRSQGESAGEDTTSQRLLGAVGAIGSTVAALGANGAAIGTDLTNQMGVGHHGYQPELGSTSAARRPPSNSSGGAGSSREGDDADGSYGTRWPTGDGPVGDVGTACAANPMTDPAPSPGWVQLRPDAGVSGEPSGTSNKNSSESGAAAKAGPKSAGGAGGAAGAGATVPV